MLFLSPGQWHPGGAGKRSRLLAEGMAARGWRVYVLGRGSSSKRFRFARTRNLWVLEIPGLGRRVPGALLYYLVALPLGLVLGLRSRAIVGIQLAAPALAASLVGALTRTPAVALTTISGGLSDVDHITSGPLAPIRRRLIGRLDYVAAQTSDGLRELEGLVPAESRVVLPTPVELPDDTPPLTGAPRAVFAGRFAREKNLERLLAGWSVVLDAVPGAELTLAGGGGGFRESEAVVRATITAQRRLRESIHLPGWVENATDVMSSCDVFVLVSLSEGMSNALVEACALRRVVVASDIAQNRAVLGDGYPLLCDPAQPEAIAQALIRAFTDDHVRVEALQMIDARVRRFELTTVASRLEDLLVAE